MTGMEIVRKIQTLKYEITTAVISAALAFRFWPSFVAFISFFWPLLVSTSVVLIGSVVVGKTGKTSGVSADDIPGKGYIEYVVGNHVEGDELLVGRNLSEANCY